MIDSNEALLLRKTGEGPGSWAARAASAGVTSERELMAWLRRQDVTGYSAMAVSWKMFGPPDFFLQDADELLDGQYADRPGLRPVADALLAWASGNGAVIQLRKTYVSLLTPRRKFAQVAAATKTSVDVTLRLNAPADDRLEILTTKADPLFNRRLRLRSVADVDDRVQRILELARRQNS